MATVIVSIGARLYKGFLTPAYVFFFFWPCQKASGILVPQPGMDQTRATSVGSMES